VQAVELFNMNYANIEQVREGLLSGDLVLSTNACVGVDCYEDFLEKMSREEVRSIGDTVAQACWEKLPGCEVNIMGSYRRGKSSSGDVDVLLTHPKYIKTIPRGALGELVSRLKHRGNIAHHLTHVEGMRESYPESEKARQEEEETLSSEDNSCSEPSEASNTYLPPGVPGSSSYMGVFWSPIYPKKRRRVDIKFYPYSERAFASLYFTGSGHFNRSMRLWATREKRMTLTDHGLFPINTSEGNLIRSTKRQQFHCKGVDATTEREIFDMLDLEFRAPNERDCFDAVVRKGTKKPVSYPDLDRSSFVQENGHKWVE